MARLNLQVVDYTIVVLLKVTLPDLQQQKRYPFVFDIDIFLPFLCFLLFLSNFGFFSPDILYWYFSTQPFPYCTDTLTFGEVATLGDSCPPDPGSFC